ncbi:glutaredoxin [Cyathus striatus]|nr:glutaredoxin [Cyathus striatus]
MADSNVVIVASSVHFKDLLNADLTRVSLINFWAPWAEPCKQMNEVVAQLAKRYPAVLVLEVEAEEHSEITDSFDIEAVPSFIILRGHTLLDRISGADASALTSSLAKHATAPSYQPKSQTSQAPAAPSTTVPSSFQEKQESEEDLNERLRKLMNQSKVKIAALLQEHGVEFTHFDILTDESVRQGLKKLNDWPTFPQLIVNGELVGGLDIVKEAIENGELNDILAQ